MKNTKRNETKKQTIRTGKRKRYKKNAWETKITNKNHQSKNGHKKKNKTV